MMSSEEEPDAPCDPRAPATHSQKRARQRVDAGVPRLAPSPLPPIATAPVRASPMSGGLYGAVFEGRPHFGLFAPGPPADMLHELLGRAPAADDGSPELAHRVLRDILQARKKELLRRSPDNNNVLATNNNDAPGDKRSPPRAPSRDSKPDLDDALLALDTGDSRLSPTADLLAPKSEPDDRDRDSSSPRPNDAKRARVENIVSGMRASPAPAPVNGCKKRKLYLPRQQHDDRRAPGAGAAVSVSDDSGSEDGPPLAQRLVEKHALASQLRAMQDQLAEMQHKYLQLCSRVASSEPDDASDAEPAEPAPRTEPAEPTPPAPPAPAAPSVLSQVMSKMMSGKLPAPGPLPPGYELPAPHPLNSAAAVYLNVSQKLFLEQHEQRLKDAERARSTQPSPAPARPPPAPPTPADLAERLDALRTGHGAPPAAAELDALAEVLKSEITASLAALIDSIVTRFVAQRRALGKQADAAAAAHDQLNKDLLRASRLVLERGSPPRPAPAPAPPPSYLPHNAMLLGGLPPRAPTFPMTSEASQGPHARAPPAMFQSPPKPMPPMYPPMNGHFEREPHPEQNEALSLVVTPKKKRHKVTDTRITPRTVSRLLGDGAGPSPDGKFAESPSPRPFAGGLALPTSVAIANPSLHESQVFSPYSPFFGGGGMARSPGAPERDSPPLPHAPALLHPALLAAAHRPSPDYLRHLPHLDPADHNDCNSTDLPYDNMQPTSSTLTPMHLRKAKLMFFWVRYPSSAVLKMYFPDIKFNKNNTAQLVKWFSNFREFYYIQMEKYARQAISEGLKTAEDIHVAGDSELYRVLNLHYNRNNHIEVPPNFRYVVEQTLREFFRAIQGGKDAEQSWKKSIYKVISRLDDPVPEYFKSPNFLEQLE